MYYEIVRGRLTRFRAARPGPIDWLHLFRASFRHPLFTRPPPTAPWPSIPTFSRPHSSTPFRFLPPPKIPRPANPNLSPPTKPPFQPTQKDPLNRNCPLALQSCPSPHPKNHSSDNRTSAPVPAASLPSRKSQNPANPDSDNPRPLITAHQ